MKLEISDTLALVLIILLAIFVLVLLGVVVYYRVEKYFREKVTQNIITAPQNAANLGALKPEKAGMKQPQGIVNTKSPVGQWTSKQTEAIDSGNMKIEFIPGKLKAAVKAGQAFTMTTTSRMQFLNGDNQFTESDVQVGTDKVDEKLSLEDSLYKSTKRIDKPKPELLNMASVASIRGGNESRVQNTMEDIKNFRFEEDGSIDPESLDKSATSVRTPKLLTANVDFKQADKQSGAFKIWEHTVKTSEAFKLKEGGFM